MDTELNDILFYALLNSTIVWGAIRTDGIAWWLSLIWEPARVFVLTKFEADSRPNLFEFLTENFSEDHVYDIPRFLCKLMSCAPCLLFWISYCEVFFITSISPIFLTIIWIGSIIIYLLIDKIISYLQK